MERSVTTLHNRRPIIKKTKASHEPAFSSPQKPTNSRSLYKHGSDQSDQASTANNTLEVLRGGPWTHYRKVIKRDTMTIAFAWIGKTVRRVVVQEHRGEENIDRLKQLRRHEHIVELYQIFCDNDLKYLIYEDIRCSLRQIAALPQKMLASEIAAVCKQVIYGLLYLHEELGIAHGDVHCGNLLVDSDCTIKLGITDPRYLFSWLTTVARCGSSALADVQALTHGHKDVKAIGFVVLELIDQILSTDATQLTLRDPARWADTEIINFLPDTSSQSLRELLEHPLLKTAEENHFLISYLERAQSEVYVHLEQF